MAAFAILENILLLHAKLSGLRRPKAPPWKSANTGKDSIMGPFIRVRACVRACVQRVLLMVIRALNTKEQEEEKESEQQPAQTRWSLNSLSLSFFLSFFLSLSLSLPQPSTDSFDGDEKMYKLICCSFL